MADEKKPLLSPYAPASIARVLDPHEDKLGATLVARTLGYLIIKVTFHRVACPDLEVKFFEAEDDGAKGKAVGDPTKTDRAGIAYVPVMVDQGLYVVEIQNQPTPIVVPTVSDPEKPFQVPTPIDRPYFDFDEASEFDDVIEALPIYEPAGDGDATAEDDAKPGIMTVSFLLKSDDKLDDNFPKYLLEATDGSYSKEISAKQGLTDKDGWKQIVFRNLPEGAAFRLTKKHNEEYSHVVFDDAPYEAVIRHKNDANQSLADHAYSGFAAGKASSVEWA